jgi:hypothetical protein
MKVKLTIPNNLDDITVGQHQAIQELLLNEDLKGSELDDEILKIVLNFDNVEGISAKDKNELIKDIDLALKKQGEFKQTFVLDGIEFGLIPNFDTLTNGEYTDLIKYSNSDEDLHRLLAVAYRPRKFRDTFKNYTIVNYEGTAFNADRMKQLPMSIAHGVVGFFLNGWNDLKNHILMSMEVEQTKV